jgi:hypothetical protein
MPKQYEFEIRQAGREWSRQFHNVVRSFAKTVTEPLTNSDTSYKRKFSLSHSSGLLELILSQPLGTKLDSSELKKKLSGNSEKREIQIHLYTAKGHDKEPRICEVVDFAEGLSSQELRAAFEEFAADKSTVSKYKPGRSLFGRGVSDVLLGHKEGQFFSHKDGVLGCASFHFDMKRGAPRGRIEELDGGRKQLAQLHLDPKSNGSCVRFLLHEDCAIPDEGTIVPALSQFYMLRLINSDPNVNVRLVRYRAQRQIYDDLLEYDFPIGDVIAKFSFELSIPASVTSKAFSPLEVDSVICRASIGSLKGREAKDARESGLLIVDDQDAVLDLTFLPEFDGAPYLNRLYGLIRISKIRDVLEDILNRGKESPLTTTRDGFDAKHEFTQLLFKELKKHLEPIYRKEETRYNRSESVEVAPETKKRIQEAMKHLNKYLTELMGEGEGGSTDEERKWKDEPIQFVPTNARLTVGKPRIVHLVLRAKEAKAAGAVLLDSDNSKVLVTPTSFEIDKSRSVQGFIAQAIVLKCDDLHEKAKITAIADGVEAALEAYMTVEDVITAPILEPPEEMEFRPKESLGQPNRKNNLVLFINSAVVPVGRKIEFIIDKSQGAVGFLTTGNRKAESLDIRFETHHLVPGTPVGRILVPWQGNGLGQWARVMAETKTPTGKLVSAHATITVVQPEADGGLIKDVKYRDLENSKCSDLVDGIIYINSSHSLNREVFGGTQKEYSELIKVDRTAQYRLSTILVEQSVFRLAEDWHLKSKLLLVPHAPVTSMREFVDEKTNELAPKLLKVLIG